MALAAALSLAGAESARAAVAHTVVAGETMWSIAAASNLTTRTVAIFNGLPEDATVVVGQTVQVPSASEGAAALANAGIAPTATSAAGGEGLAPASSGSGDYVVAVGESLSTIAAANGISVASLASANGRSADAYVYAGESLQISAAAEASSPAAASSGSTVGLGHVPSPYGELHLDPGAAADWNAMRDESIAHYDQDIYPAGPVSAHRTYEQQAQLYEDYLNGIGPLAAPPGTSAHELGRSVDLQTPEMRSAIDALGAPFGWGKTEAFEEWWHVNYFGP